jgi:type IV secretion system protein VirB4
MAFDSMSLIVNALEARIGTEDIVLGATAAAVSLAAALAAVGPLSRRILPPPRESWLSEVNPFETTLADGTTLVCKDGALVATIALKGIDMATVDFGRRGDLVKGRKRWIDMLAGKSLAIRCFGIRRKRPIDTGPMVDADAALGKVVGSWHAPFSEAYENVYVLVLTVPGSLERARDILNESVQITLETLREYKPSLVSQYPEFEADPSLIGQDGPSPLLTLWNELWNPVSGASGAPLSGARPQQTRRQANPRQTKKLAERMRSNGIETEARTGLLRFSDGSRERFAYCIAVSDFGEASSDAIVAEIMSVDAEILVLHHMSVDSRNSAELFIDHRSRMALSGRAGLAAQEARAQFEAAVAMLSPDSSVPQSLCNYQLTVFAFGDTPEQARQAEKSVRAIYRDWRINPITDTKIAACQWFLQFPTYDEAIRPNALFSQNVAEFVNFESISTGHDKCMWGNFPTLVFPTASRAPYKFIFHENDKRLGDPLGHTAVIGRTGSGKTTVMSMIVAGALRYPDLRVYMFDRYRGLHVFVKAMGGEYISIDSSLHSVDRITGASIGRLQPLQVAETRENRMHLINWFKILSGLETMNLNPADKAAADEQIGQAIKNLFALKASERTLEHVMNSSFPHKSTMYNAMRKWIDPAQLGAYFNGPPADAGERLKLRAKLTAFDMTETFNHADKSVPAAIGLEIFHRIQMEMRENKAPALLVIDEAPAILADPGFRAQTEILLREFRKLGGTVVLMFQTPDAMDTIDPAFGTLIRKQTANHIFFRDAGSSTDTEAYAKWGLGPRELAFVKRMDPRTDTMAHAMLLRRSASKESVVLDTSYERLGRYRHLFASGSEQVELASALQREDPRNWIERYVEESEEIVASGRRARRYA